MPPYVNLGTLSLVVIAVCMVVAVLWGFDLTA